MNGLGMSNCGIVWYRCDMRGTIAVLRVGCSLLCGSSVTMISAWIRFHMYKINTQGQGTMGERLYFLNNLCFLDCWKAMSLLFYFTCPLVAGIMLFSFIIIFLNNVFKI